MFTALLRVVYKLFLYELFLVTHGTLHPHVDLKNVCQLNYRKYMSHERLLNWWINELVTTKWQCLDVCYLKHVNYYMDFEASTYWHPLQLFWLPDNDKAGNLAKTLRIMYIDYRVDRW